MDGSARAARRLFLLDWYANAPVLFNPPERDFWVISARKEGPEVRAISWRWLTRSFPDRVVAMFLLQESRTIKNVVAYKARTIAREGFTDFTEDNPEVVRGVAKVLPSCRVWLFKDGAVSRFPVPVVASSS
jgi:hypothetical protein